MTTKKPTPPKADDGALRAAMAALSKRPLPALREAYEATTHKPASGLSRAALIKSLVTMAGEQPAPSHPTRAEQAEAKASDKRRTGPRDPRLPAPGTVIERQYKGKTHRVEVREDGFRYDGRDWRSLTAIAKEVTGYKAISGTLFFGIAKRPEAPANATPGAEKPAPAPKAKRAKKAK